MKINRYISLDPEVSSELAKETNASKLINSLLMKYYENQEERTIAQLEEQINSKKLIRDKVNDEIIKLENQVKFIKDKLIDIPEDVIKDMQKYKSMTEESLTKRYTMYYIKKYPTLELNRLIEAYRYINKYIDR